MRRHGRELAGRGGQVDVALGVLHRLLGELLGFEGLGFIEVVAADRGVAPQDAAGAGDLVTVQALRDAGADIALATDCNPGTSPLTSLLLTMNMSATLFRLTVEECLAGATREAARALGLDTGPMSGFDNAAVDKAFFAGTNVQSNFICTLGYGDTASIFARSPRPEFARFNQVA